MEAISGEDEGGGQAVLVVDDNRIGREVICRQVRSFGLLAEGAESGAEALDMLGTREFGLILLDLNMEPLGGLEVLEKVRQVKGCLELPVLMISATHEADPAVKALELGADDFLVRPINKSLLQAKIRQHLGRRREQRVRTNSD